jgi:hypothetical protein
MALVGSLELRVQEVRSGVVVLFAIVNVSLSAIIITSRPSTIGIILFS